MRGYPGYAREHLKSNDYYEKGHEVAGTWVGEACQEFGVQAGTTVADEEFDALASNQHPVTGKQLTARMHKDGKERRAFYDFTLSAPKSFSVVAVTGGKSNIRAWHRAAVEKTVREMERTTGYHTRSGGKDAVVNTGKFCAAVYSHDASRSLDPQLHDHLVIFNATPGQNGKTYAIESREYFDKVRYFTAVYRNELAVQATRAGMDIEWVAGKSGELVPEIRNMGDISDHFSSRGKDAEWLRLQYEDTIGQKINQKMAKVLSMAGRGIDREAFSQALTKLDLRGAAPETRFDQFVKLVRAHSDGGLSETTTAKVIADQRASLSPEQLEHLDRIAKLSGTIPEVKVASITKSLDYAIEHHFERVSVLNDHELLQTAIEQSKGEVVDLEALKKELSRREGKAVGDGQIVRVGNKIASSKLLQEEIALADWVATGKGVCGPLGSKEFVPSPAMNPEQRSATQALLASNDNVLALQGRAGAGKTFTCAEIVRGTLENGGNVMMVAPSDGAREVLNKDGADILKRGDARTAMPFQEASTVQMLLKNKHLQEGLNKKTLLLVDESSFLDTRMMGELRQLQKKTGCRILLVGDARQINSVGAGDPFRDLLRDGIIQSQTLSEIQRQKVEHLKQAAKAFSRGETAAGLQLLDDNGHIIETTGIQRYEAMAEDYLKFRDQGVTALCINLTHRENEEVARAIRGRLKATNELGQEQDFLSIRSLGWSQAQKKDLSRYQPGQALRVTTGKRKGQQYEVVRVDKSDLVVRDAHGRELTVKRRELGAMDPVEKKVIPLAPGDVVMARAGETIRGGKVINGELITVKEIRDGQIIGVSGVHKLAALEKLPTKTVSNNVIYGYASTAEKSQGVTVEATIFGLDRDSINHVNQKKTYVPLTRETKFARMHVESKAVLFEQNARGIALIDTRTGERVSARSLVMKPTSPVPDRIARIGEALSRLSIKVRETGSKLVRKVQKARDHRVAINILEKRKRQVQKNQQKREKQL